MMRNTSLLPIACALVLLVAGCDSPQESKSPAPAQPPQAAAPPPSGNPSAEAAPGEIVYQAYSAKKRPKPANLAPCDIVSYNEKISKDVLNPDNFYQRGMEYLKGNRPHCAADDFAKAAFLVPHNPEYQYRLGSSYRFTRMLPEALIALDKAIELDKTHADYYNVRGVVRLKLKQLEQARDDFLKALELDPKAAESMGNLGVVYHLLKQTELVCPTLKKACELGNCATLKEAQESPEKLCPEEKIPETAATTATGS